MTVVDLNLNENQVVGREKHSKLSNKSKVRYLPCGDLQTQLSVKAKSGDNLSVYSPLCIKVESLGNSLHKCKQLKVISCLCKMSHYKSKAYLIKNHQSLLHRYYGCKTTVSPLTLCQRLFSQKVRFESFASRCIASQCL